MLNRRKQECEPNRLSKLLALISGGHLTADGHQRTFGYNVAL